MTASDFRRIALMLEGTEEGSHMGAADFRVGGRIFATLASERQGFGNLMLNLEQQAAFIADQPDVFLPVSGTWGRNGATHVRLALVSEDILRGALRSAWKLRIEKNQNARLGALNAARRRSAASTKTPEIILLDKRRKAEMRARLTTPEMLESVKKRYGLID
ncbi:MAG TPA: MmcQ/YjbR family DNA-binding protein [Terracidiphilus sp.]|nr:MmcQ/YjbR family DNA-binding protein [Terracidiphilus sp.]